MCKKTIGQAMRECREKTGLSLRDLSRLSGVSVSWINKSENDVGNPTAIVLVPLADALGVSIDEYVGRDFRGNDTKN